MSTKNVAVIIDDDSASRELAIQQLRAAGYQPVVAGHSTVEAVAWLQPDAVLLRLAPGVVPDRLLAFSQSLAHHLPHVPLVLYAPTISATLLQQAMASGIRRFILEPLQGAELATTLAEARQQLAHLRPAPVLSEAPPPTGPTTGSIVACFGAKGGVGTTTLAVNIAVCLRQAGHRVALVDGSVNRGNVGLFLNLAAKRSMLDLLGDTAESIATRVHQVMVTHSSGVDVLLAPPEAEQGDRVTPDELRAILTALRASYDIVIVDTSSLYDDRTLLMLELADRVVVPTEPCIASIRGLTEFMRISTLLGHDQARLLPVVMRATSVHPNQIKAIEEYMRMPLSHRVVSDGRRVIVAQNEGTPLVLRDRNSPVAQNMRDLALALLPTEKRAARPAPAPSATGHTQPLTPLAAQPVPAAPDRRIGQTRFLTPPVVRRLAAGVTSAFTSLPHRASRI